MMKNRKAFTLIEMLIVIVIIGILLTMSMWISGNRIQTLRVKSVEEQISYNFNDLFSKNLLTNYQSGMMYDDLFIYIYTGDTGLNYEYKANGTVIYSGSQTVQSGKYKVDKIFNKSQNSQINNLVVKFSPYKLGCELLVGNDSILYVGMRFLVNDTENKCFELESSLCKISPINCEQLN